MSARTPHHETLRKTQARTRRRLRKEAKGHKVSAHMADDKDSISLENEDALDRLDRAMLEDALAELPTEEARAIRDELSAELCVLSPEEQKQKQAEIDDMWQDYLLKRGMISEDEYDDYVSRRYLGEDKKAPEAPAEVPPSASDDTDKVSRRIAVQTRPRGSWRDDDEDDEGWMHALRADGWEFDNQLQCWTYNGSSNKPANTSSTTSEYKSYTSYTWAPSKKTSDSHPIDVDYIPQTTLPLPGKLGMTFCPGKTQEKGFNGDHARDMAKDLDRMKNHYGMETIVTLIEKEEMESIKVTDLFDKCHERDIEVIWFPHKDRTAPVGLTGMHELVHMITDRLASGRNIIIHCKGGLGRTGTVAACVLVAMGWRPGAAISEIRRIRTYTIEKEEQEKYVYRYWWYRDEKSK